MAEPDITPFQGDREDESPRDFIKKMKRIVAFGTMRQATQAEKIEYFSLLLKDGGPAEAWFDGLPTDKKDTWAHLTEAFDARWPATRAATKSKADRQEELAELKLTEEELCAKVEVRGVEVYTHVAWADKVQRAASAIPDNDNLLVKGTRDNMPPSLKALVPASHDTWTTFCNAVRAVNTSDLREKTERGIWDRNIEAELRRLKTAASTPPVSTKSLAAAFGRMQLSTPAPAPTFTAATATQPAAQQYNTQWQRTNAEKWTIISRFPKPATATDANRTAYRNAVGQWHANNPRANAATEDRPYPLTPGTTPLGSGECTGCGQMGHTESTCTAAVRLPQVETKWRRKVDSIRRAVNEPPITAGVNLVETTEGIPVTPEQLRALFEAFLEERGFQGKAEGSSD